MGAIDLKTPRTELATLVNQSKALHADIEAKGDAAPQEDRDKLTKLIEDGKVKRLRLDSLEELADQESKSEKDDEGTARKTKEAFEIPEERKSLGTRVIESKEYKDAPTSGGQKRDLPPVKMGGMMKMLTREYKALYATVDAAGGYLLQPDRQPEILDIIRQQPLSVLDLVNQSTTNSDLVEYIVQDARTNNAAVVSERTASGGGAGDDVFGLKPESNLTLDLETAAVKTIAHWVAISRQLLNDAPRLRAMIDDELLYMLKIKMEALLLIDILAWTGIQSRVHATSGARFDAADKIADTLRRAITDLYLEFYQPDGIVLNPAQGEALELDKDDNNNYLHVYDSATAKIWRVRVVETAAMTAGSALVAHFKLGVTVWDREQANILTGQPDDYFLRNAFAILAELRAAWAVTRPKAVEKITGLT